MLERYIGTKIVNMLPMTRAEYNGLRGWQLPVGENGDDEGYLVEYLDGGPANTPQYEGYVSWSPKAQADAAYRPASGMPLGLAIEAMRKGAKVSRAGWNGKGMFLFLVPGSRFQVNRPPLLGIYPEGTTIDYCPHVDMRTADGKIVPWLASQADLLADDWMLVE